MKKNGPIKVIIADTSFIIRKGLRALVGDNKKFENAGEAFDAASLQKVVRANPDSVLIVDHCCDDCFSLKVIETIRNENPALNILVISHEKNAEEIKKVISLGIKNYLLKDCDEQEVTDAISACAKGQKYFCGQIIDILLDKELSALEHCVTGSISDREIEVIKELVSGRRPKEIAERMHLSYHTVVTHKRNIYSKLGISNAIELAQYAIKTGLVK